MSIRMPYLCAVKNCKSANYKDCNVSFFSFPSDPVIRAKWIKIVPFKTSFTPTKRVCSKHFNKSDFIVGTCIKRLKKTAVPSVFSSSIKEEKPLFVSYNENLNEVVWIDDDLEDYDQLKEQISMIQDPLAEETLINIKNTSNDDYDTLKDENNQLKSKIKMLEDEVMHLKNEVKHLKKLNRNTHKFTW
nr:THAP domain-containing protein 1-like [Onthophagus taurus]